MPKQKPKAATETALLLRVEVLERNLTECRNELEAVNALAREYGYGQGDLDADLAGCLREAFAKENKLVETLEARCVMLAGELAAAKSNYDEQTKSVHQISERMQKEYAVERERVAAWQKTCNEQTERAEASRVRADAALQEAAEARARAYKVEDSLFMWRLTTFAMAGAAIAMGGMLLWGS